MPSRVFFQRIWVLERHIWENFLDGFTLKAFPQSSQVHDFDSSWLLICSLNWRVLLNSFPQNSHVSLASILWIRLQCCARFNFLFQNIISKKDCFFVLYNFYFSILIFEFHVCFWIFISFFIFVLYRKSMSYIKSSRKQDFIAYRDPLVLYTRARPTHPHGGGHCRSTNP